MAGRACWRAGESSMWPESAGLIWKRTRISNSRRTWWVKCRLRLFTVSHQAIRCTPRPAPSRRIASRWSAGPASSSRREKLNSSSRRRRSRNRAQVVDEEEDLGAVARRPPGAVGPPRPPRRGSAPVSRQPPTSTPCGKTPATRARTSGVGMVLGRAVEDEEAGPRADGRRPGRRDTAPPGSAAVEAVTPSAASSFWPTIRRWLPPSRRNRAEVGSLIAMASPSQAWADRGDVGPVRGLQPLAQQRVAAPGRPGRPPRRRSASAPGPACARWASSWSRSRYASRRSSESQTTWKKWLPSGAPLASL